MKSNFLICHNATPVACEHNGAADKLQEARKAKDF